MKDLCERATAEDVDVELYVFARDGLLHYLTHDGERVDAHP